MAHTPHHSLAALNGLYFPSRISWGLLHGPSNSDWVSPQESVTTPAPGPTAPRLLRTGLGQVPAGHQLPASSSRSFPLCPQVLGAPGASFLCCPGTRRAGLHLPTSTSHPTPSHSNYGGLNCNFQ